MAAEGRENVALFSLPRLRNLKHSGNLNSPLHTLASVPFSWEEHPGKPLPSTSLSLSSFPKCLHLPPRLLFDANLVTNPPSLTTVLLDDSHYSSIGKSISFRFLRKGQVSSDGPPESTFVVRNRNDRGSLLGSWRKKDVGLSIKDVSTESEGKFVQLPGFSDHGSGRWDGGGETTVARVTGRKSSQAKSRFWATIYGTFKQVMPRRSTTRKKDTK